jgi:hypothetical protein
MELLPVEVAEEVMLILEAPTLPEEQGQMEKLL